MKIIQVQKRASSQEQTLFKLAHVSELGVTSDCHVTRFSDFVDLWVIKIKTPMTLCARSTWRDQMNREHGTQITQQEHVKGLSILKSK